MKRLSTRDADFADAFAALLADRAGVAASVAAPVAAILEAVRHAKGKG